MQSAPTNPAALQSAALVQNGGKPELSAQTVKPITSMQLNPAGQPAGSMGSAGPASGPETSVTGGAALQSQALYWPPARHTSVPAAPSLQAQSKVAPGALQGTVRVSAH